MTNLGLFSWALQPSAFNPCPGGLCVRSMAAGILSVERQVSLGMASWRSLGWFALVQGVLGCLANVHGFEVMFIRCYKRMILV